MSGRKLDRDGIFKAVLTSWKVQQSTSPGSQSVGVNIGFRIVAQLNPDDNSWVSWENADEHYCYGTWWVIGKAGKVNQTAIDQLYESIGWEGDLTIIGGEPPRAVVQIVVKDEPYNGQSYFKATWMNHEHYTPTQGASESSADLSGLSNRFGSLLRAAAAGAKAKAPVAAKPAEKPATAAPAAPAAKAQAPAPQPKSAREPRGPGAPTEEEARAAQPAGVSTGGDTTQAEVDAAFDRDIPF